MNDTARPAAGTLVSTPSLSRPDDDKGIDAVPRPVASRARDLPDGHHVDTHRHRRAQLLFASNGTMVVTTPGGIWVVPTQRAVWIPAFVDHAVVARGQLALRSLYFTPSMAPGMPETWSTVSLVVRLCEPETEIEPAEVQ